MPTPRKFAIVLSVGGTPWAIILLMYVVGISIHSGDSSARFAWIFLPGFASYTFWLSRAFNMWFGRWRHVAWLGAAVVNIGYLLVMFPVDELRWNDTSGVVARTWLLFAATLSVFGFACDRKSKPTVSNESLSGEKRVPEAELKKLIDEHRKAESNKSS